MIFSLFFAVLLSGAVSAASADIQVNQTVNNTAPHYGSTIKYATTVTNKGPDAATGVQITTKIPKGLTYISDDSNGAYNPTTGIWTIGTINDGVAKTLNIITNVTSTGIIKNNATKTAQTETDPQIDNNAQKTSINVPKAVDIKVNQYLWFTPSAGSFDASNVPAFVVDVRNMGTLDDATNVVIEYDIGNGFQYSAADTRGNGYTTLIKDSNGKVTAILWTIPYMPKAYESTPGGTAFMNVFLKTLTTGTNTPNLTNTATLKSVDQDDINNTNNQTSTSIIVRPSGDIQVNQTITGTTNLNSQVKINITVKNNGPDNSTGVTIKDLLPNGLTYISDNSNGAYNPTTGMWTIGNLNNGITQTLIITAQITTTNIIKNTAALTAPLTPNFIDWNYNNNAQTTIIIPPGKTYTPQTNITVTQYLWAISANGSFDASNTPTYVVDVRNKGSTDSYDDATNVVVKYIIADGYQYIGCDTRGNGNTTLITDSNGKVTAILWTIPYMPKGIDSTPGGTAFMNVFLRSLATGTQTANLTNNATVISPIYTTQPTQNATTTVRPSGDIQVNQTITGTTKYNNNVTITITAKNNGPDNSTGVTIKDLLPNGLTYISDNSNGAYNPTTGMWTIGNLNNGITQTLIINAQITATGTITNTAALTAPLTPNFIDWNYNNNAQTNTINIPDAADIAVTQTINNTKPSTGDTITIIINTTNNGPDIATGVNITDLLPAGLQYVSSDTNYGTFSNGIWTIQNILNGDTGTLTIIAKVINIGNFVNTASKTAENEFDWNTQNDAQSVNLVLNGIINKTNSFTNEGTTSGTINSDDGTTTAITLPFPVTFYGQTYTTVYISVNGLVSFGSPVPGPYYNAAPPSSIAYIAPFWADLDVTNLGNITYLVNDNNITITWDHLPSFTQNTNPSQLDTFSVIITKDGKFAFIYGNMQWKNDENIDSTVRINKGDNGTTYKILWNGTQDLNILSNKTIWFDSNGNTITPVITVTQTPSTTSPKRNTNFNVTVNVTNNGLQNATGVQITDLIPSGLTIVSSTPNKGNYTSSTGIWNIGNLNINETATLTFTLLKTSYGHTTYTLNATKTAENEYEPVSSGNSSQISITVS